MSKSCLPRPFVCACVRVRLFTDKKAHYMFEINVNIWHYKCNRAAHFIDTRRNDKVSVSLCELGVSSKTLLSDSAVTLS